MAIRLLPPDATRPMVLPCRSEDLTDSPNSRDRALSIITRHARAISDTVQELADMGLVENATVQIRAHPCPPMRSHPLRTTLLNVSVDNSSA